MKNSTIGILGFGVEGQSTLRYLIRNDASKIVIMDKAEITLPDYPKEISIQTFSGDSYKNGLKECDIVIRSAGIYPLDEDLLKFQMNGGILKSQVEIFFDSVPREKIIAVTGTLGKGSTVSIIKHIFDSAKEPSVIGGNFGIPMLDLLEDTSEKFYILELSSFQLMTLSDSPKYSVILKVSSEHLDWHKTVEEYRDAKANLIRYQKNSDCCIYMEDSEPTKKMVEISSGQKFPFGCKNSAVAVIQNESFSIGTLSLKLEECKIKGAYQLENMAAAALVTLSIGIDIDCIFSALKTYESLPLRMEFKGEKMGIEFYNDSYATRPDATIAAVKSMKKPFALILGGSEKNADFTELFNELKFTDNLKQISFIGQTSERMLKQAKALDLEISMEIFSDLESAFKHSLSIGNGGAILLSPACASFGLFKNYKHRGEVFNKLVEDL